MVSKKKNSVQQIVFVVIVGDKKVHGGFWEPESPPRRDATGQNNLFKS